MNSDKLYKESLEELEHYEKYENFPLEQTPNFYLKRTLTEYEMEQVKLSLNVGLRDKIFIKQSGIENRFNAIFAIGVENVIR